MTSATGPFQPLQVGKSALQHRIVMAPMTRYRSDDDNVPLDFVPEYYAQRASVPGTLLITEATYPAPQAAGSASTPGIWSPAQIARWKEVTHAVHEKGSFIYCQLWALGRAAKPDIVRGLGFKFGSSSATPMAEGEPVPEALSEADIKSMIEGFAQGARNAIEAGFDGVEIHGANGYLLDQFLQDTCNRRSDRWGGSVENRSRFAVEVATAVATAIGPDRTGIRLSPFSSFQGMKMADPIPQFSDVVGKLRGLGLAYLHLVEPRIAGNADVETLETNEQLIELWGHTSPLILAGGFSPRPDDVDGLFDGSAKRQNVLLAFGRYFIPNPDLVFRIRERVPVLPYDRSKFYNARQKDGYIDYDFSPEFRRAGVVVQ